MEEIGDKVSEDAERTKFWKGRIFQDVEKKVCAQFYAIKKLNRHRTGFTGTLYRKSCASSAACLTTSSGYQAFCTPGKINSICITCCSTPLCNGPRPKKRGNAGIMPRAGVLTTILLTSLAFLSPANC
ncbi:ly6/PLAUR domain-containing protein 1 isoform X3 [Hemicordylus capensis]|uniref:ly6/PLAUR domain-containing protein 1 isoform X3 n=1 Tax=Hemicordylus capensis TaxID=884348 RepID=UPI002302F974|nr:ly6/PLAUR domain-containing protein 1 isoform X3 [Hemicordylus capensis]XP_053109366.1 ly6/PLAUR domain-containing protein 1 isoform X3 [Hemicordylus capensis]XP_053109375.1 ly6/PLAUR domain-containing protein 1 isoform X3 [Hemicordylus capensis]XP_053109385.1 ly6/PLAUR domain-containing protein 1 isoform X3 [Hemicordylus capensis]XP_053109391.1 ly6/PLAUR domain-containing protein 1 isoform X3 [Hemicordylus capensis]